MEFTRMAWVICPQSLFGDFSQFLQCSATMAKRCQKYVMRFVSWLYSIGVSVDIILPHVKLPSLRFCRANDMRSMPDSITGQARPMLFL
jgi:hypothetical protein